MSVFLALITKLAILWWPVLLLLVGFGLAHMIFRKG